MAELKAVSSNVVELETEDPAHLARLTKLERKAELNELRARDAEARCRVVDAELKIMKLRSEIEDAVSGIDVSQDEN